MEPVLPPSECLHRCHLGPSTRVEENPWSQLCSDQARDHMAMASMRGIWGLTSGAPCNSSFTRSCRAEVDRFNVRRLLVAVHHHQASWPVVSMLDVRRQWPAGVGPRRL